MFKRPDKIKITQIISTILKILLVSILIYFLYIHLIGYEPTSILELHETLFFIGVLALYLLDFAITTVTKKEAIKNINKLKDQIKELGTNNLSKRLEYGIFEEINTLVYFTNSLLDKMEVMIESERLHALVDPLTECYNRRALKRDFESLKDRAIREKGSISILLIDIDNFKKINDTYGHDVGDKILIALSKIMRETLRKYDRIYRIGGEEFLVVFYTLDKLSERRIITRLNKEVSYKLKKEVPGIDMKMSFSGGFVKSNKFDLNNPKILDEMLKTADKNLYNAKKTGKDKIVVEIKPTNLKNFIQ